MKNINRTILFAFLVAISFGMFDVILGYFFFYKGKLSFLDLLIFNVPPEALYYRTILIISLLIVGVLTAKSVHNAESLKIKEQQNRLQNHLLESEEIQEKIGEVIPITRTDLKGRIIYVSKAYEKISGYSEKELFGHTHSYLRHPDTPNSFYKELWKTLAKGDTWEGEILNIRKNGEEFYIYTHIMPEYNSKGKRIGYIAVRSNITYLKKLERLASYDRLTGLLNRGVFDQLLEEELKRSQKNGYRLCVIMFDIDHFKRVNDTYGHGIGDEVLKKIAKISLDMKWIDNNIGRIGGEEFAIFLPKKSLKEAVKLAKELKNAINSAYFPKVITVSASFGVTQLKDSDDIKSLMKRVDKALYLSKNSGRNKVSTL